MATIGSRRKPKAYKNRSIVRLTNGNDIGYVSSSYSKFDLGGGNDKFYLWGNQNIVFTSGGIDQLSLIGNGNIVKAQGSKVKTSAYFVGDNNYFFNYSTMYPNSKKFKVFFEGGTKQTAIGANVDLWSSYGGLLDLKLLNYSFIQHSYGTINYQGNYSSFATEDETINVKAGSENTFAGAGNYIFLPNARSKVTVNGEKNRVSSGSKGCVVEVNGRESGVMMQGESIVTINGAEGFVRNQNNDRKDKESTIYINGYYCRVTDDVQNHTGALNIHVNHREAFFTGENARIYLNGTMTIDSKSSHVEIGTVDIGVRQIELKLAEEEASYIEVLRTGNSRYFSIDAKNGREGDIINLIGEIEYGKKGRQGPLDFVSLIYKNNVVGVVNYDSGDRISVNGSGVTW